MKDLDASYWENRYQQQATGWDLGEISMPLKSYLDGLQDRSIEILVPGAGNGHEVAYAYAQGFSRITMLDFASSPLDNFHRLHPDFLKHQLVQGDFFLHQGQYDLILEQTFFCAIDRKRRQAYVKKMHELLRPGGKLVGVLFGVEMPVEGPPFGGSQAEYEELFSSFFKVIKLEACYNSIIPRMGNELFMILERRD